MADAAALINCPGCNTIVEASAACCPACGRCLGCGTKRLDLGAPCMECGLPYCECCGLCPACGKRRSIAGFPACRCGHPQDAEQFEKLVKRFGFQRRPE